MRPRTYINNGYRAHTSKQTTLYVGVGKCIALINFSLYIDMPDRKGKSGAVKKYLAVPAAHACNVASVF